MDKQDLDLTKIVNALIEQAIQKSFSSQQATQEIQKKFLEERIESLETKCQQLTTENANLKTELEFLSQQAAQETQKKLLEELQKRIESLETKCQQLTTENANLTESSRKLEVDSDTKHNKTNRILNDFTIDLDTMRTQFGSQDNFNAAVETELNKVRSKLNQCIQQLTKLQQQQQRATAGAFRGPVKSPSTSSFQSRPSNNDFSSLPLSDFHHRVSPSPHKEYLGQSIDLEELSDAASDLAEKLQNLNSLNESFKNISMYSND